MSWCNLGVFKTANQERVYKLIKGIRDIVSENIEYLPKLARYGLLSIKKQNKGADLGYLWIWLKPLMYVGMFYIALAFGIKNAKDIDGIVCPYIIWLASGLYPWFFMQSYAIGNAKVFLKYKAFIKKQNYPVSVIPTIPLTTGFFIHLSMILLLLIMALFFGVKPSLTWLQIPVHSNDVFFVYLGAADRLADSFDRGLQQYNKFHQAGLLLAVRNILQFPRKGYGTDIFLFKSHHLPGRGIQKLRCL